MHGPRAFRVDDQWPVLPELHVNYIDITSTAKHSYSSIDTSHRPFQLLLPSAEVAGILPERIHQMHGPRAFRVDDQWPFSRICTLTIDIPVLLQAQLFE
jgi:hypothetical protein